MKKHTLILMFFATSATLKITGQETIQEKIKKNKATYAFFGTHAAAAAVLACGPWSSTQRQVGGIAFGAWLTYLGYQFTQSYLKGLQFTKEAQRLEQLKVLNTTDWTIKNAVVINGTLYSRGCDLWQGYQRSNDKKHFLRSFLSVISVDAPTQKSRKLITDAVDAIKWRLSECANPNHERYTPATAILGRVMYHVAQDYPWGFEGSYPHNIATWLWEEESGGQLFKKKLQYCENMTIEELLNDGFVQSAGVYETDPLAKMFSVKKVHQELLGFTIPWYSITSASANGAARYYVALLKQYIFLLACRALCDEMIAMQLIDRKLEERW